MRTFLVGNTAAALGVVLLSGIGPVAAQQQEAPPVYSPDPYASEPYGEPAYDPYEDGSTAEPAYDPSYDESAPYDESPSYDGYAHNYVDDQAGVGQDIGDVSMFYGELEPYGTWVDISGIGRAFRPSVANFQPYRSGYWVYTEYGLTWVSHDPFGWATDHYGRWVWYAGNWYWVPGRVWGPAWVSWRHYGDYVFWMPLSYDYRRWPVPDLGWRCVRWQYLTRRDLHRHYMPHRNVIHIVHRAQPIRHYRNHGGRRWILGPSAEFARARGVQFRRERVPARRIGRIDRDYQRVLIERAEQRRRLRDRQPDYRPNERVPAVRGEREQQRQQRDQQIRGQRDRQPQQRAPQQRQPQQRWQREPQQRAPQARAPQARPPQARPPQARPPQARPPQARPPQARPPQVRAQDRQPPRQERRNDRGRQQRDDRARARGRQK